MKELTRFSVIFIAVLIIIFGSLIFFRNPSSSPSPSPTNNQQAPQKHISNLESFYDNKSDYDSAFQNASNAPKQKTIAGIISHHFLAKDLIAQFFNGINPENIKNVYIIGPDHYGSLSEENFDLATTKLDWDTPYGIFHSNPKVIDYLRNQFNVKIKDLTFRNEHSIYTLIPFAKKAFPDARVTPLVLKPSGDYQKYYDFGKIAYRDDSILIVSTDFSHQATEKAAYENDTNSIRSLVSSDMSNIESIESDCKQCIAFLYGYISHAPSRFKLVDNKTSADFSSEEKQNLTSYVSAYYIPDDIRLLFGGDMMLDRYIRQVANQQGYDFIFQKLSGYLLDKDLVVVNLEGPITTSKSISIGTEIGSKNNYFFTFDQSVAEVISNKNIKLVNIGNNHILNFGSNGLSQTKQFLSESHVNYFGNTGLDDTIYSVEIKGEKMAFINYNQFAKNGSEKTVNNIKKLRADNDFVFVYAHWGNEYAKLISRQQRELAHQFIDSGADAVIGSHPHVIQESEIYKGKKIYYSLGNLIFDQYFSEDTQKGLLVELIINLDNNNLSFNEHQVTLQQNGQTKISE